MSGVTAVPRAVVMAGFALLASSDQDFGHGILTAAQYVVPETS